MGKGVRGLLQWGEQVVLFSVAVVAMTMLQSMRVQKHAEARGSSAIYSLRVLGASGAVGATVQYRTYRRRNGTAPVAPPLEPMLPRVNGQSRSVGRTEVSAHYSSFFFETCASDCIVLTSSIYDSPSGEQSESSGERNE